MLFLVKPEKNIKFFCFFHKNTNLCWFNLLIFVNINLKFSILVQIFDFDYIINDNAFTCNQNDISMRDELYFQNVRQCLANSKLTYGKVIIYFVKYKLIAIHELNNKIITIFQSLKPNVRATAYICYLILQ